MMAVMGTEAVFSWRMTSLPFIMPLYCLLCSSLCRGELHSDLSKEMAGHVFMFILCWSQNDDWWLATGSLTLQSQSVQLSSNFTKSLLGLVLRNGCFLNLHHHHWYYIIKLEMPNLMCMLHCGVFNGPTMSQHIFIHLSHLVFSLCGYVVEHNL